jgi:hypothetical protein
MSKKQINQKRNWRIGSAIVVALFALLIGFLAWLLYVGSPKEVISVADQFKPGLGWNLTQNQIDPPRNVCIDIKCPGVTRTWVSSSYMTKQGFESLIKTSGWKLYYEDGCFDTTDILQASCWAHGVINGYRVVLSVANDSALNSKPTLRLTVEK